jgi:prophage maintenance system killer protein
MPASNNLSIGDVVLIAAELLNVRPEVAQRRMRLDVVQRALMAPVAEFDGEALYEELELRAAVVAARLAQGKPLLSGSSRLAWVCMREFVRRNGHDLQLEDPDDAVATLESLAAGLLSDTDFAVWVRAQLAPTGIGRKTS